MTNPTQQRAARTVLVEVARQLGVETANLRVLEVERLRRYRTKTPFYRVLVEDAAGNYFRREVSVDGTLL